MLVVRAAPPITTYCPEEVPPAPPPVEAPPVEPLAPPAAPPPVVPEPLAPPVVLPAPAAPPVPLASPVVALPLFWPPELAPSVLPPAAPVPASLPMPAEPVAVESVLVLLVSEVVLVLPPAFSPVVLSVLLPQALMVALRAKAIKESRRFCLFIKKDFEKKK
jgi:hypothetical protein